MLSRKPGYLIELALLTLVLLIPQACGCYWLADLAWKGFPLLPPIPGFTRQNINYSEFSYGVLWRDQFVRAVPDDASMKAKHFKGGIVVDWMVRSHDPESETMTDRGWKLFGDGFRTVVLGDRLFFCGRLQSFEVIDNSLHPIDFPRTYDPLVLVGVDGEMTRIQQVTGTPTFAVFRAKGTQWANVGEVVLPTPGREFLFGSTTVDFQNCQDLNCINRGDRIHTFVRIDGHLFYRQGLRLRLEGNETQPTTIGVVETPESDPADEFAGWTLIREDAGSEESREHRFGTLIDGQPGALIVDHVETGRPVGSLYKYDGARWSQIATIPFPFGSNSFRTIVRRDDQSPYIVATTSVGAAFAYVAEPTGILEVGGQGYAPVWKHVKQHCVHHGIMLGVVIGLGILPIVGVRILMAWTSKPDYMFGVHSVKLASMARRGLARLIDITLIAGSTAVIGWALFRHVDWWSVAEARNLKINHPAVIEIPRLIWILVGCLAAQIVALVIVQGLWGITPGKWICGLRTVRTTLRPAGIARSLAREFILAFESCYLLWWIPAVLSIAITDRRQRFGDVVADTIVIKA